MPTPNALNLAEGAIVRVEEPTFTGYGRGCRCTGRNEYTAEIVGSRYDDKRVHWFLLHDIRGGDTFRRKAKNVYANAVELIREADTGSLAAKDMQKQDMQKCIR